ncbi:MAG: putative transporter [Elusimicrobiota bacterium]|jgi:putative transport protein
MNPIALLTAHSIAQAVILVSLVAALGLALGNVRLFKVNLGIAGVLFSGILFGHFGITLPQETLEFLREFGLILFVYTIGMQVGPGFLASLRKNGLRLNLLAASVVLLGVGATLLAVRLCGLDMPAAVGIYSGAVTNTPSLAAAQQALKDAAGPAGAHHDPAGLAEGSTTAAGVSEEIAKRPGIGYAVAYPFGILGTILVMILMRLFFRVDPAQEAKEGEKAKPAFANLSIRVENRNLEGLPLERVPMLEALGVRVSRLQHAGEVRVPQPDAVLHVGDVLLAVGPREKLEELALVVGKPSEVDLMSVPSAVTAQRVVVTQKEVLGKTLAELALEERYGVTVTRASRADIEILAGPDFDLHFGDTVLAVGEAEGLKKVAALLGNSPTQLNHPQLIPVFVGIALGVLLGQVPIHLPGVPAPVKLGLAGGPLVMAILLSRVRRIGPLSWYMPISANFMLRELGIILFLSCVGLRAGDRFVETLTHGDGLRWLLCGAAVTFLPLMAVALFARLRMKLNYLSLCGLLAGSMTDPPALSFANSLTPSSATSTAYATVYPLVMLLRVVSAQVLVFLSL